MSCGNEERRYKYNTYNFNKKLSTPPQSQSLSLQLRCVLRFVLRLSFVSLRCVCVVSVSYLRLVPIHQGFASFLSRPRPLINR